MTEPAIVLRDVVKRFGRKTTLDNVSVTAEAGQLIGLVGPDGAGKTTFIRLIAALLHPNAGRVSVFGHDTVREAARVQAKIGYMPQNLGLHAALTVMENLELHADLRNIAGEGRVARIAELVQLTGLAAVTKFRAGALPQCMRRKLALACALIGKPRLLLLDEPGAAVDPVARHELFRIARELPAQGMTVVWSSASFDQAERCPYVLLLSEGRIIGEGPPALLSARLAGRAYAMRAIGAERRRLAAVLRAVPGVQDVQIRGAMVRFTTETAGAGAEPRRAAALSAAFAVQPRLEDAFIASLPGRPAPAALPVSTTRRVAEGPAIELRGIRKCFGGALAVDDVSLSVAPGEIFGLFGPSGAGKTTLLRIICGLLSPAAGSATVAGLDLQRAPAAARARLGYMSQQFSLYGQLSVAQNLHFFAAAYNLARRRRRDRVDRLLSEFALEALADARCESLSPSVRQRVALAASLVHEPDAVLLDDPTAGTDPVARRDLWRRIDALAADGTAVIVASQSLPEAEYCDRLLLLYRGRSLGAGRPDDLMAAGETAYPTMEDAFVARIEGWERRRAA